MELRLTLNSAVQLRMALILEPSASLFVEVAGVHCQSYRNISYLLTLTHGCTMWSGAVS